MVCFQTKNPNLEWKMLLYFMIIMAIWHNVHMAVRYSLWSFGIFSPFLVCLDQEKSGNHGY
jgi:hypothetical protein